MPPALATMAVAQGIPRFSRPVRKVSAMPAELGAAKSLRAGEAKASAVALNCRRLRERIHTLIAQSQKVNEYTVPGFDFEGVLYGSGVGTVSLILIPARKPPRAGMQYTT